MNRRIRLSLTFALGLVVLPATAFAQAAAEAALLKAGTSAATAKAGKALGSTLDKASQRLAGRVQQQVSRSVPGTTSPTKARAASPSPAQSTVVQEDATPAQGLVIASIQGGTTTCVPAKQTASTPESKTAAEPATANCRGQEPAAKPAQQKYQSVITLSSAK